MDTPQAFENQVLERLNAAPTVRGFLNTAVGLLSEAIAILIFKVFRKDDYAVKYAVEPLLFGNGPLGELPVRLKLIYGLGVISRREYDDAEQLLMLHEALNGDDREYTFTDDKLFSAFAHLHCVTSLPTAPRLAESDDALQKMLQQRYQQMVRSMLTLSLTGLISRLGLKAAFDTPGL